MRTDAQMRPVGEQIWEDVWDAAESALRLRVSDEIRHRVGNAIEWPLTDKTDPIEDAVWYTLEHPLCLLILQPVKPK